ncbi:MAG TPA: mechanosensitive ion channel family protein [Candidatus Omnitrophota bacterium]|nr:mechanosensitive ion channel family protein [Candidatus Omnitrophota bacterium]
MTAKNKSITRHILFIAVFLSWGVFPAFAEEETADFLSGANWQAKLFQVAVILLVGLVLFKLLKIGVSKMTARISEKNVLRESGQTLQFKTLLQLVHWTGSILIVGVVVYMLLDSFGLNMAPLLAGAGIAGLAFGFGGQYLIRDVINGIFILVEGQYRIDDVVKIGDHGGLVESVNLRHTRLRDLEGRVIYIPNGEIKSVINFTKEFSYALFDIGIAYKESVDEVMKVIVETAKEMRRDEHFNKLILSDLEMLGVDGFESSQVTIKCRIKTLPIKQWEVAREFRRRLKNRFDELGIEIPFPHQTVYFGSAKENDFLRQAFSKAKDERL